MGRTPDESGDGLDGQRRRNLACVVSAHAVGHAEQRDAEVRDIRIFVGFTHASDIGHGTRTQQPEASVPRGRTRPASRSPDQNVFGLYVQC